METMVFFNIGAVEVSARVAPAAAGDAGQRMPLMADLRHMHVIDPKTTTFFSRPTPICARRGSARARRRAATRHAVRPSAIAPAPRVSDNRH